MVNIRKYKKSRILGFRRLNKELKMTKIKIKFNLFYYSPFCFFVSNDKKKKAFPVFNAVKNLCLWEAVIRGGYVFLFHEVLGFSKLLYWGHINAIMGLLALILVIMWNMIEIEE